MPISTDSDGWSEGEPRKRLHNAILQILEENRDEAYDMRELADKVYNTNFESQSERRRLEDELSEEEYTERLHNDELPGDGMDSLGNEIVRVRVEVAVSRLVDMNLVEVRSVESEYSEYYSGAETVPVVTFSGYE
jgi:hypothetical protein